MVTSIQPAEAPTRWWSAHRDVAPASRHLRPVNPVAAPYKLLPDLRKLRGGSARCAALAAASLGVCRCRSGAARVRAVRWNERPSDTRQIALASPYHQTSSNRRLESTAGNGACAHLLRGGRDSRSRQPGKKIRTKIQLYTFERLETLGRLWLHNGYRSPPQAIHQSSTEPPASFRGRWRAVRL
jgi:hypothetical protein